jgi:hypothetical protein
MSTFLFHSILWRTILFCRSFQPINRQKNKKEKLLINQRNSYSYRLGRTKKDHVFFFSLFGASCMISHTFSLILMLTRMLLLDLNQIVLEWSSIVSTAIGMYGFIVVIWWGSPTHPIRSWQWIPTTLLSIEQFQISAIKKLIS